MTEVKREKAVKIEGRQYIVVADDLGNGWAVGTILTLTEDDGTNLPWFEDGTGKGDFVYTHEVMLLAETEEVAEETVSKELQEHKYSIGQKLKVTGNKYDYAHCFYSGKEVEVVKVGGLWSTHEAGVPLYRVKDLSSEETQTLMETQLDPVEFHISDEQYAAIEVGDTIVIRSDLETGNYGADSVTDGMLIYRGSKLSVEEIRPYSKKVSSEGWNWTQQMIAEVIKKEAEKPAHKFFIGSTVKIVSTDNSESVMTSHVGETAVVKELVDYIGKSHTENGTPYYKVVTETHATQVVTEFQLEEVTEKPESKPEAGKIYFAESDSAGFSKVAVCLLR